MAMTPKLKMEWMETQHRLHLAGSEADVIVERLGLTAPIDPLKIIQAESPFIRAGGRYLGDLYDGKLEYRPDRNLFLLFYNTKYDAGRLARGHHPRTRFSICHELGHYFLERHRAYLMRRRIPHGSRGELRSDIQMEREADTFAASILLPRHLAGPIINRDPLSVPRLQTVASDFDASLVSTMFRAVGLSDFPCAVAGIRDGAIAWMFPSESLISAGIYPSRGVLPSNAQEPWDHFRTGSAEAFKGDGTVSDWFQTFSRDELDDVFVQEEYVPVASMGTLLVLLTLDEADVFGDDDDEPSEYEFD